VRGSQKCDLTARKDGNLIVSKLHRRHTARLLDELEEIKISQIALKAVKIAFSQYTNDIKQVIIESKLNENNHNE
jgi:uncharacterized protein YehS (DUF1456 family)